MDCPGFRLIDGSYFYSGQKVCGPRCLLLLYLNGLLDD